MQRLRRPIVWEKQFIPRAWRRAGGVLIPKEKRLLGSESVPDDLSPKYRGEDFL